mgnify:FL=1
MHPKMRRGRRYTQKKELTRMMAIGIVLRSTCEQPVPKNALILEEDG